MYLNDVSFALLGFLGVRRGMTHAYCSGYILGYGKSTGKSLHWSISKGHVRQGGNNPA